MSKSLTLTVVANMTSNYGEGIGNIASVQKVYREGKVYAIRSRESLKNAIMVQSGFYDDLQLVNDKKVTQKDVSKENNASNCRALEGGYMNTVGSTVIRNSSFYLTDAVSTEPYVIETRFHNNLYMAQSFANANGINLQEKASECGLMPYQYEYDKSMKVYSMTVDLDMIGCDKNFDTETSKEEKAERVIALLEAVESLSLVVKGNLDNAEPLMVFGGITERKTHYFENVVKIKNSALVISQDLKDKLQNGCSVGLLQSGSLKNEEDIIEELNPVSIVKFFENMKEQVKKYYEV